MPKIQFKRGLESKLPVLAEGEPGFTTDTQELYIGSGIGNVQFAKSDELANLQDDLNTELANKANKADVDTQLAENTQEITDLTNLASGKSKKTLMIGHRGASMLAPENSIAAFILANKVGMWGVECDVRTTSDGKWVVIHDATIDRTTNGIGTVNAMTLADIRNYTMDAGYFVAKHPGQKIPTLEELLITCKNFDLVPVIEIKSTGNTATEYDLLVQTIVNYGLESSSIIICDNYATLQEIRSRSKKIVLQYLTTITTANLDAVVALGNCGIDIPETDITQAKIELAHSYGVLVNVWTINSYLNASNYIDMGVDFITTDIIGGVVY